MGQSIERFFAPRSFARFVYGTPRMDEMARHMHMFKDPLRLDEKFLMGTPNPQTGRNEYAVPRRFWKQAVLMRFEQMFEMLQKRQAARMPIYEKAYNELYPKYLHQFEAGGLKGLPAEKRAGNLAKKEAEEVAERAVPHVDYPEESVYEFQPTSGKNKIRVVVRPNLKEMIDNIEREQGKDGFDLWYPRRSEGGKMATRGFNFPTEDQIGEQLRDWINHTAHGMLGQLPAQDDPEYSWKREKDAEEGLGKAEVRDSWTIEKRHTKEEKKWMRHLRNQGVDHASLWREMFPKQAVPEGLDKKEDQKRKLASALAWRDVYNAAKQGELRTPPPNSQVIRPKSDKPREKDGRYEFTDNELHLPHRKAVIHMLDKNGNRVEVEKEIPVLMPGRFVRPIEDHERGAIPEDKLLGHEKDYVDAAEFPRHPFEKPGGQGTNHVRSGHLMPNQNTTGRKYLPPGADGYDERLQQLEASMERGDVDDNLRFTPNPDGPYFRDIVDGIVQGLGEGAGGAGAFEREILKNMFPQLHHMAYQNLTENLDDDRIYSKEGRNARVNKAKILVGKYAQQDWGMGTRRKRGTGPGAVEAGTLQEYVEKIRKRAADKQREEAANLGCPPQRGQGGRMYPGSRCEWKYDMRTLHDELLKPAEENALLAEKEMKQANAAENPAQALGDAIGAEQENTIYAFYALSFMYQNLGDSQKDADQKAQADVLRFRREAKTPSDFVARVRHFVEIMERHAGPTPQPKEALTPEIGLEWQRFERFVNEDDATFVRKMQDPDVRKRAEEMVQTYPVLADRYNALLFKLEQMLKPPAQRTAPPPAPKPSLAGEDELIQMFDRQEWAKIAFTPRFQKKANPRQVAGILRRLEEKVTAGTASQVDRAAIILLKKLPQLKGGV